MIKRVGCRVLIALLYLFLCSYSYGANPPLTIPKSGGALQIHRSYEPPTLNPLLPAGMEALDIQFYILESLLAQDEETLRWQPRLAREYKVLNQGKTYEFYLRDNAKWSDGMPVTTSDVLFSYECIFDDRYPTAHLRPYYEFIDRVEKVSSKVIRFHTKERYFGNFISSAGLPILPKHIYGNPKKATLIHQTVIGSGPYAVEKYQVGQNIVLRKNPNWWGNDLSDPQKKYLPESIIFRFVGDLNSALQMLKQNQLDYVPLTPHQYLDLIKKPQDSYRLVKTVNQYPTPLTTLHFNLEMPLFKNRKLRKALGRLVDYKFIARKFYGGLVGPANGPWYNQSPFSPVIKAPSFNPKLALKELKALGWRDIDGDRVLEKVINSERTELSFTIFIAEAEAARLLTVFQQDAQRAGVKVDIRYVDWNALSKIIEDGNYDSVFITSNGGLVEFDPYYSWHSNMADGRGSNFSNYKSKKVDALLEKAREEMDFQSRIPLLKEAYKEIASDAPGIFLFNDCCSFYAHSERVGKEKDSYRYDLGIKYWWIKNQEGLIHASR